MEDTELLNNASDITELEEFPRQYWILPIYSILAILAIRKTASMKKD
jgi:hypothetical protein